MKDYFCGWYFKCQSGHETIAVIPAFHKHNGHRSCSIQIITDTGVWNIPFPRQSFHRKKGKPYISIGENIFCEKGMKLSVHTKELNLSGAVRFGKFAPLRYDIMGPFCCVPKMECRHSVYSMQHTVDGTLHVNGKAYVFENSMGYLEGDRGYSFPQKYAWTQCFFDGGSLMLSVAEIPLGRLHFTGIIAIIRWQNKEYRLATYLGAKAVHTQNGELTVRQKNSILTARLIKKQSLPLCAPDGGAMSRTIHESPSCSAAYHFRYKGHLLFSFETDHASFEYEYY